MLGTSPIYCEISHADFSTVQSSQENLQITNLYVILYILFSVKKTFGAKKNRKVFTINLDVPTDK